MRFKWVICAVSLTAICGTAMAGSIGAVGDLYATWRLRDADKNVVEVGVKQ